MSKENVNFCKKVVPRLMEQITSSSYGGRRPYLNPYLDVLNKFDIQVIGKTRNR